MEIKSISASRQKTYDSCQYKYLLTYALFECKNCSKTQYIPEIIDKKCKYCGKEELFKYSMPQNWGSANGTALHWVLEEYANACRGKLEDGTLLSKTQIARGLDWRAHVQEIFQRGHANQGDKNFSILDVAKPKEYQAVAKTCLTCPLFKDSLCSLTKENPEKMPGCPKKLYDIDVELMANYLKRNNKVYTKHKILGVESDFTMNLGQKDIHGNDMMVIGFMDYVYELDEDTVEMIDYKFGSHVQTYDEVYNDIQARIYSAALRQKFPGYKDYILTFDYIRESPVSVIYTKEDDVVTKAKLIEKWEQIAAPQTVRRNVTWQCKVMCVGNAKCDKLWEEFKKKFGAK